MTASGHPPDQKPLLLPRISICCVRIFLEMVSDSVLRIARWP